MPAKALPGAVGTAVIKALDDDNVQIALVRWFERRAAIYTKTARSYSGKPVTVLPAQDLKVPAPAWTEPPNTPNGAYTCRIHVQSAIKRILSVDPITGKVMVDGNKFHSIVSGLVYHEMGHVIYTPPIQAALPGGMAYYGIHALSFFDFIEKLPNRDELYFDLLLINIFNSGSNPASLVDFIVTLSERVADAIEPWVVGRLDGKAARSEMSVPFSAEVMRLANDPVSGTSKQLSVFAAVVFSDLQNALAGRGLSIRKRMEKELDKADRLGLVSDWVKLSDNQIANEAWKLYNANYGSKSADFIAESLFNIAADVLDPFGAWAGRTVSGVARGVRQWHQHFNILEDQRLETQLASAYLGMGYYFTDAIVSLMTPGSRYFLTNGRYYLSDAAREADLADEKSTVVAAAKQNMAAYGPIAHGWYRFMPMISRGYVTLLWSDDSEEMNNLVGLSLLLNAVFAKEYEFRSPVDQKTAPEQEDVTNGNKASGKSSSEKHGAAEAKEKLKKLEQEKNEDPGYDLKKQIQAAVIGLARALGSIGAAATIIDSTGR